MSARWTSRVAWMAAGLSVCLALGYVVLLRVDVLSGRNVSLDPHWLPGVFWAIGWPVIGAVVLSKHPDNRLAWVFVLVGLGSGLGIFAEQYTLHGTLVSPGSLPAIPLIAWVGVMVGNVSWVSISLVPQLFPDGRPLSPRWRALLRLTVLLIGVGVVYLAAKPGRLFAALPVDNPFGVALIESPRPHWVDVVSQTLVAVLSATVTVGALVSLVVRYARARGSQRQQMKLFVAAVLFSVLGLIVYPYLPLAFIVNAVLSLVAPVAFGVAMMRYRLYDIDRVISRTFAYAVLTGLLLAVYVVLVTAVTRLLPHGSSLAVAIATLGVAALFQPLRRRVQGVVDHRFNRARFDAERTIDDFARRLRSEVALETVRTDLLGV
ncbi:MAG: hypothetical protein M3042_01110, partial [Actinomycetota bacterium]|nr:hypothetical protein [Actinomycetota bacterium]